MRFRACALIVPFVVISLAGADRSARAQATTPALEPRIVPSPESVTAPLQRALAWYQDVRIIMQAVRGALDANLDRGEVQTAQRVLQRTFDAARARAAILALEEQAGGSGASPREERRDRRAQLQAAIERDEREIAQLRARLRAAPAAARPALERALAAATNRQELNRVQLDFVAKLNQIDAASSEEKTDLLQQIQALQESVPELSPSGGGPTVVTTSPAATSPTGAWALVYRLLALQRHRSSLKELSGTTAELARETEAELQRTQQAVRPMVTRLRQLAENPTADGASLPAGQQEFRSLLDRTKLLGSVILPLREESVLLRRFAADVQAWIGAIDGEVAHVLRGIGIEFLGVGIALAAVLVGSVLWRVAVVRYVSNPLHRRLLLTARHIVVIAAVTIVLIFHFTTELTALVATLGFAAAGIAFALQNVILAVAGYFTMVAPNGIRIGDRVSLQGPFGYVHGEVIEIGVVRMRLEELAGDPLQPTGRIMVFPNSVVFTGSFIKHAPAKDRVD